MIVFDLKCGAGHVFEAWFRNSQTFEGQQSSGDISCPLCGDAHISKAIMAPNISVGSSDRPAAEKNQRSAEAVQPSPALTSFPLPDEYKKALDGMRQLIRDNCEDVGKGFAEEAKKIHYGEAEKRGIYGVATPEESQELQEEGIDFMQLPIPIRTDS